MKWESRSLLCRALKKARSLDRLLALLTVLFCHRVCAKKSTVWSVCACVHWRRTRRAQVQRASGASTVRRCCVVVHPSQPRAFHSFLPLFIHRNNKSTSDRSIGRSIDLHLFSTRIHPRHIQPLRVEVICAVSLSLSLPLSLANSRSIYHYTCTTQQHRCRRQ